MSFNIAVEGGKSVRLPTAGKYCAKDIVVTATVGDTGGYDQGVQAEHDRFWDNYIPSTGGYFAQAFSGYGWTDATYNPNQAIICTKSANKIFHNSKFSNTKVPVEFRCTDAGNAFTGCNNLQTIPHLGFFGVTNTSSMFSACSNLESITFDGSIDVAISFANASKLTNESVQSIIDHLKDLTGETTQKLTFHATVGGKLTDAQKAQITAKNWTLVY